jgi:hypothetical protein
MLVVDDVLIGDRLRVHFRRDVFDVRTAMNGRAALTILHEVPIDVVISDSRDDPPRERLGSPEGRTVGRHDRPLVRVSRV